MTEAELRRMLRESIAETLDAMFFVSVLEPADGGAAEKGAGGSGMTARVEFAGGTPGRLTVRMAAGTAREIAAGFLGEEEGEVSERQIGDVVRELTNMICGFVLSRLESGEAFRLGEPRLVEPGAPQGGSPERITRGAAGEGGAGEPAGAEQTAIEQAVETGAGALEAALEMEGLVCPP